MSICIRMVVIMMVATIQMVRQIMLMLLAITTDVVVIEPRRRLR